MKYFLVSHNFKRENLKFFSGLSLTLSNLRPTGSRACGCRGRSPLPYTQVDRDAANNAVLKKFK